MAVSPKAALGTVIALGRVTTTATYDTLLGARNIQGPTRSLDFIDTTSHSSANNTREFIPSLLNAGECTFELLYDSGDTYHTALMTAYEGRTLRNFKITYPDTGSEVHSFSAYVASISLAAGIDDAVIASVTLRVSGAVTRTT